MQNRAARNQRQDVQIPVAHRRPPPEALRQIEKEAADRNAAIVRAHATHAIGSLVAEEVHDLLKEHDPPETVHARYYAAIERLTAATWRASGDD